MSFSRAAIDRFTVKRAEEMEGRLQAFLDLLHTTPIDKTKWDKGMASSMETDILVKDIYLHLEHRIALGDESLMAAAETIAGKDKEHAIKDKEIAEKTAEIMNLKKQLQEHLQESTQNFDRLGNVPVQPGGDKRMMQVQICDGKFAHQSDASTKSNSGETTVVEIERLNAEIERHRVELRNAKESAERWEKQAEEVMLKFQSREDQAQRVERRAHQENEDDKCKIRQLEQDLAEMKELVGDADAARKEEEKKEKNMQRDLAAALQAQNELQAKLDAVQARLVRSQDNTRSIFDELQDLRGNLRVMCRVRPPLGAKDADLEPLLTREGPNSDHSQVISMSPRHARDLTDSDDFQMERIFKSTDTNDQIFTEVSQLVGSAINGRNVCIFAYGQTGSGKTHTMNYPWNAKNLPSGVVEKGIIPRSVAMISEWISERRDTWKFEITGRYIEIYAEKVFDLLRDNANDTTAVEVKFGQENRNGKTQDYFDVDSRVVNLTDTGEFEVKVQWMLTRAAQNRRTRATASNTQSSRSHSILSLRIFGQRIDGKSEKTDGTLNMIDLAGSEKPSTTDRESQQEGIKINQSLTSLRKVFGEMADPKRPRVSFRESMLTKLLQSSLGEGCKTLMIVMVSPLKKDREETRNTLQFAMLAQKIKLRSNQLGETGSRLRLKTPK